MFFILYFYFWGWDDYSLNLILVINHVAKICRNFRQLLIFLTFCLLVRVERFSFLRHLLKIALFVLFYVFNILYFFFGDLNVLVIFFDVIVYIVLRNLGLRLNFRGTFWVFWRFCQFIVLRLYLFRFIMRLGVTEGLIFFILWLRIIKSFCRRFIKPRFFVHFIEQPSYLWKNPFCKKFAVVVVIPFSKLIPKAPAFFTALVPDSYVVINCYRISFLLVNIIQVHKTVERRPVVRAAFFIKINP